MTQEENNRLVYVPTLFSTEQPTDTNEFYFAMLDDGMRSTISYSHTHNEWLLEFQRGAHQASGYKDLVWLKPVSLLDKEPRMEWVLFSEEKPTNKNGIFICKHRIDGRKGNIYIDRNQKIGGGFCWSVQYNFIGGHLIDEEEGQNLYWLKESLNDTEAGRG